MICTALARLAAPRRSAMRHADHSVCSHSELLQRRKRRRGQGAHVLELGDVFVAVDLMQVRVCVCTHVEMQVRVCVCTHVDVHNTCNTRTYIQRHTHA